MIKALKVTMILYAAIGILFGLAYIFFPNQLGAMFGHTGAPAFVFSLAAMFGVSLVAIGTFLIIAAQDPIKHVLWVKYAIVYAILSLAAEIASVILGYVTLGAALTPIILHAVFAVGFIAFYPRRAA
jgi:hypothetical protein